ncbi:hypothetical protein Ade02nite_19020 [Paractinoplanes deccanensis]|uniref:Uncharacterized protein n=1 Tax=Paractinoplanes deccanensis TaxID=113561 RepID=A0ABQ3XZT5_9ACTN|nr:hypothetical protein [Actinoplanes deccanensis]GID73261.1 hypothetical protein Ade02nite_19020 [Actinoplanes deccanensis]
MSSHFRTLTVVAEIPDESDLRYCGYAAEVARKALEQAGFVVSRVRNEHNEDGEMPPWRAEIPW